MEHDLRRVAVVGAGMAGLACAAALHAAGLNVTVFDKGRRAGGRMATRRVDGMALGVHGISFDHGASNANAHDPEFAAVLAKMEASGDAAPWPSAGPGCWSGIPGMSALGRHMERLGVGRVHNLRQATFLTRLSSGWMVRHRDADPSRPHHTVAARSGNYVEAIQRSYREADTAAPRPILIADEGGDVAGPFDAVLLALPAPQAAALLHAVPHRFAAEADRAGMSPRWTLMLAFAAASDGPDLLLPGGALSFIKRDSSQPGRAAVPECWVAHAGPDWSRVHLEDDAAAVQAALVQEFAAATGISQAPLYAAVHRWRYALTESPLGVLALWDPDAGLGVCGDWCLGARVEDAFTSGRALAGMLRA